jgi:hypothetical protein
MDWTFDEGWRAQAAPIAPVFASEDAREGSTAFAEKRACLEAPLTVRISAVWWADQCLGRDLTCGTQ